MDWNSKINGRQKVCVIRYGDNAYISFSVNQHSDNTVPAAVVQTLAPPPVGWNETMEAVINLGLSFIIFRSIQNLDMFEMCDGKNIRDKYNLFTYFHRLL